MLGYVVAALASGGIIDSFTLRPAGTISQLFLRTHEASLYSVVQDSIGRAYIFTPAVTPDQGFSVGKAAKYDHRARAIAFKV